MIQLTNRCDGTEVSDICELNCQEARERECNVDYSEKEYAVDTDLDSLSHVELIQNKPWQSKDCTIVSLPWTSPERPLGLRKRLPTKCSVQAT